jgi:feruloyl esterase
MTAFAWNSGAMLEPGAFIPATLAPVIQAAVNETCDALDDVADGVVGRPRACGFDPERLLCTEGVRDGCLRPEQLEALRAIYRGAHTSDGAPVFPGFTPGAEVGEPLPGMGWDGWVFGGAPGSSTQARFATNFMRHIVTGDESWQLASFDLDRDVADMIERIAPVLDATDPDMSRFADRGGKLIIFHGWADAAVPPENTIAYFEAVGEKMGETERDAFARLFLAPGMQHCFGGPGPSGFGGTAAAIQPPDPSRNLSAALERWVEHGEAPERVRAIKPKNPALGFYDAEQGGVDRSGLVCAYPSVAKWDGKGSTDDAASYSCAEPWSHDE